MLTFISSIAVAVRLLMAIGKRKPSSDVLKLNKGRSMCWLIVLVRLLSLSNRN